MGREELEPECSECGAFADECEGHTWDNPESQQSDLVDQIINAAKVRGIDLTDEFWAAVWSAEMPIRLDERAQIFEAKEAQSWAEKS